MDGILVLTEPPVFQSTRPLRGATYARMDRQAYGVHFNPRAPCGARRTAPSHAVRVSNFNPRAPCGARLSADPSITTTAHFNPRAPCGARLLPSSLVPLLLIFQSTRPLRGATWAYACYGRKIEISIHAPLAGRDLFCLYGTAVSALFQSTRPLRGATGLPLRSDGRSCAFQSTRPLRGATRAEHHVYRAKIISIHAPLAGRDHFAIFSFMSALQISIHAPLAGRDTVHVQLVPTGIEISIHAPLAGRDGKSILHFLPPLQFQSTRPLRGAT